MLRSTNISLISKKNDFIQNMNKYNALSLPLPFCKLNVNILIKRLFKLSICLTLCFFNKPWSCMELTERQMYFGSWVSFL